jgi:eukaryotic-like serine/threonine-protein kinase
MGSVWSATHVALGRRVAVKFIDVAHGSRDAIASRFLREARLAAAVRHPHVVDILDFGLTEQGEPVMVMELLEGDTLATRTKAGPRLTTEESVDVMAQVLSGLDAVHRAGVLHCDIKPANIIVERAPETDGLFARLLDFGIAYAADPRSELSRGRFGTDAHSVFGTPEYMSPEQAEGRTDLDERADVYAVSVILYELLSGASPFQDEHPGRVLFRVMLGSHVPLVTLRPDLPALAAVVEHGMTLDREARAPSARALRRALLAASGRR